MSIRNIFKRRGFYSVALSVMLSVIFVATAVSAATTIDSNINTGGTLSVTGATTLSSTVTISGALTANAAATLNENGTAVDFRVESDTQANMLYVDGTNDRVGIASSTPQAVLSVENTGSDDSFVVNDAAADSTPFVIDASGNVDTGGTLSVTGATTLSSTVTISGALTANAAATLNENGTAVDFRVESDTQANMLYVDGTNDRVGIASSTPQAVLSVENTGSDDSFVVNDAAADSTPFVIDASGNVGVASSSPAQEVGVNGDVHLGSAATSTLTVESSNANEGGCIELEGTNDTYFRIYATASTSNTGQLIVEAGKCQ